MPRQSKTLHPGARGPIHLTIAIPGTEKITLDIPNTSQKKDSLLRFIASMKSANMPKMGSFQGDLLREKRRRAGLSQNGLAKLSGVSQENISKMETGKRPIGKEVAKRLAPALGVDPKIFS